MKINNDFGLKPNEKPALSTAAEAAWLAAG